MALTKVTNRMTQGAAVSVLDYGADPTGATDSATAIQSALNDATEIFFPDGTYLIESTLTVTNSFRIFGNGLQTIIRPGSALGATDDVIHITPSGSEKRFCSIENISIIPESGTPARHSIHMDLTDPNALIANFKMEGVLTEATGGYAFYLTNPTKTDGFFASTIVRNKLKGGIFMERAGDSINVSENLISGSNEGIRFSSISGASQIIIDRNNITASGGAIYVEENAEQVKIRDNQIEQSQTYNGDLSSGETACIAIIGTSGYKSQGNEITGNNINNFGNADYCVRLEHCEKTKLSGNVLGARTASGFETDHLLIKSSCENIRVFRDNVFNSVDTTTDTTPRVSDSGVGTCGLLREITDLQNSWTESNPSSFGVYVYKDPASDLIHLMGLVSGGTTTSGTVILSVPDGYTPRTWPAENTNCRFHVVGRNSSNVNVATYVTMTHDGDLQVNDVDASVYLDGISYVGDSVFN